MTKSEGGRLVWNHSTHLDGLIPVLERLANSSGIKTITPGVLSRVKAHSPKLKIRLSVPIRGGFKAIARQGKTAQEVFILTTLSQAELEEAIAQAISK
ncbi:MAG: metal-binding protein [Desertifilum sp. SIO1I2]|nr:metal-binding protein [Desertifilum sp. SIO1I2]